MAPLLKREDRLWILFFLNTQALDILTRVVERAPLNGRTRPAGLRHTHTRPAGLLVLECGCPDKPERPSPRYGGPLRKGQLYTHPQGPVRVPRRTYRATTVVGTSYIHQPRACEYRTRPRPSPPTFTPLTQLPVVLVRFAVVIKVYRKPVRHDMPSGPVFSKRGFHLPMLVRQSLARRFGDAIHSHGSLPVVFGARPWLRWRDVAGSFWWRR